MIAALAPLVEAFRLPAQALVEQRIAKKLLAEQGAPTAADKRLINDTVDELWWHAALKPGTVGVPAHADVIELALVALRLRQGVRDAQAQRLLQLIHRAIPYPVLLVAQLAAGAVVSVAHKRASLGDAGKWVLGDSLQTHAFDPTRPTATEAQFLSSLALDRLPRSALADLAALYQGYADGITALAVANVTGQFVASANTATAAAQRVALDQRQQVLQHLQAARGTAAKSRQMNRRVQLNLRIQRLQNELQEINGKLPFPLRR